MAIHGCQEKKAGEYYLEITNNSAESVQTLKWYAGKVRDIKPGEFEAELSENVKEIYYNLTVDETGWYRFDSGSLSMGIKDKETEEFVSAWSFCKLESGHTYYITVSKSEVNPGTSSKWSVKKGKAISVELGQVNRNENSKEVYYVFVPETTGKYTVKEGASVYDENWKTLGIAYSVPLTAGKTYYFTVDRAQYWSIQKYEESEKETIAVQTGTTYTTPFDKNREINYTFTPDTTAIYRFRSQQDNASLSIKECDWQTGFGSSSGKIDFFIALEKGKTYEFSMVSLDKSEIQWNITKAGTKTANEGTEYTTTKEETTVYDFVPSKSGEYMFSSKDGGTGKVYSSDWKEIEGCLYDGAAEFGMKVSLEQGKTYHLGIALSDKEAKWKIEPVKESSDYTYRVLSDNTVEILKYSGVESNVTVPDKIDNKVVKSVGYGAFAENENIVGVTIPAQVTDLQYGVFASCANLETVTFKEGSKLQKIAARAFENCSKLHSVSLPDSVQTIEENGFAHCKNLGPVDLGNGLKNIENNASTQHLEAPVNVIYQTAEDGLGDTIKPRLLAAGADCTKVMVIDDSEQPLTMTDVRLEEAIVQTKARMVVLDPIQGFLGAEVDMHRANEIRPLMKRIAVLAEKYHCAIILIGHMNKNSNGKSSYRGLGSIDFQAAARSVLIVGRIKDEPEVRVVCHTKSSLAPEGKAIAFRLDKNNGFEWIGEYDISADELLNGEGKGQKTRKAKEFLLEILADGGMAQKKIEEEAEKLGIKKKTLRNAKMELGIDSVKRGNQWYWMLSE